MSNPSPLFKIANENKWEEVIKTYKEKPEAHTAKITSSGDTALHIAISNGEESVVNTLVAVVRETEGALEMKNELGNTPLHLAAYLGNANMCSSIAGCNSKLVGLRNDDNETPFFLAVRHGRKEAFHALHKICKPEEGYDYCRGKDGETILHSAISGEYFDLAYFIMNHYRMLGNATNEKGFSPLHILANKPSAFRSGSQIRGLHKLIYLCISVDDQLQPMTENTQGSDLQIKEDAIYPENYQTCVGIMYLLRNVMRSLLGRSTEQHDEENIKRQQQEKPEYPKGHERNRVTVLCRSEKANAERLQYLEAVKGSNKRSAQGHELFPKNYITFFNIAKLISKAMLVILGLGSEAVEKMREKKAKHIWSLKIMEKMLEDAKFYEYEKKGKSPIITVPAGKDSTTIPYTFPNIVSGGADAGDFEPTIIDDIVHGHEDRVELQPEEGSRLLFVKNSMPPHFFPRYNNDLKTPTEIFSETHGDLAVKDGKWLISTSQSCSVVAALVATVAFTASSTIPGGVKSDDSGTPTLQNDAAFTIFAISSLVALCLSVTSVVMFLAILTARYQEKDFRRNLPMKLLVGLTSLLISIACMLLSFCAGHFLVMKDKFEYASLPMYVITCLPLTFFAIVQFPQYLDLVLATISKVPQTFPSSDVIPFVVKA